MWNGFGGKEKQRGELGGPRMGEQGGVGASAIAQVVGGVVACEEQDVPVEQGDGVGG